MLCLTDNSSVMGKALNDVYKLQYQINAPIPTSEIELDREPYSERHSSLELNAPYIVSLATLPEWQGEGAGKGALDFANSIVGSKEYRNDSLKSTNVLEATSLYCSSDAAVSAQSFKLGVEYEGQG